LFNIELGEKVRYHGNDVVQEMPKLQWISSGNVPIKIVMNDGTVLEGFTEPDSKNLSKNDIIQFVRFGFCRMDDEKDMRFYFTHK
jgi:hypothetical protein